MWKGGAKKKIEVLHRRPPGIFQSFNATPLIWLVQGIFICFKEFKKVLPRGRKNVQGEYWEYKSPREVCPPQGIKAGMSVFFNKELK